MFTRETEWRSYDGKVTKIKDLEDTHLVNIINHLTIVGALPTMVTFLREEAKNRGLTQAFINRAEIPHKNDQGDWMLWNYDKRTAVKVG